MHAVHAHSVKANAATYNSVEELAAELGISRATAYAALRNRSIPSIRIGKRFVIPRAAIAEWLRSAGDFKPREDVGDRRDASHQRV
jgi:excisionase family DNA binding protein